uniref:serine-rich adhesin for platelets-like isoform X1 n=1 Tax=Styela clava TaxID=7725 RepID=UPI0019399B06|nr:serine-rich adhesin for platelets-like isoform X1 [Styela clava]
MTMTSCVSNDSCNNNRGESLFTKDIDKLQLMFKNASNAEERIAIRQSIQRIRSMQDTFSPTQVNRRSYRRSKRMSKNETDSIGYQNVEQAVDKEQELGNLHSHVHSSHQKSCSSGEDMNKISASIKGRKECLNSTQQEMIRTDMNKNASENGQHTELKNDLPQVFVRNSSTRRNRRSKKSSALSSDQDDGKGNIPKIRAIHEESDEKHYLNFTGSNSERGNIQDVFPVEFDRLQIKDTNHSFPCDVTTKLRHSSGNENSVVGTSINTNFRPNEKSFLTAEIEKNSYRSVPSSSVTVDYTQGATCQYKTISTSFRGPTWKPVSPQNSITPPTQLHNTPQHRSVNNNNNNPWNHPPSGHKFNPPYRANHTEEGTTSGGNEFHKTHGQKNSARVVLKALSKKLFSGKPKSPGSASGQQALSVTPTVDPSSNIAKFFPQTLASTSSAGTSGETPVSHLPKSSRALRPSPFQERKKFFEQGSSNPTSTTPVSRHYHQNHHRERSSRNRPMADVISISRSESRDSGKYSPQASGSPVATSETRSSDEDAKQKDDDDSAVEELENLLKQYKDHDKRVKIRETIRLLKESLREGDSTPSGSRSEAADSPSKTPTTLTQKSVFETTTTYTKPESDRSAHKLTPDTPVEFSVSFKKPGGTTTLSRFSGRSTSLRTTRPSYQPPAEAVQRTSSFKLTRPKDFIIKKVDSSPQLSKVVESVPSDFREYADSLNNNIPEYKLTDQAQKPDEKILTSTPVTVSSTVSHNKTASPFSVSGNSSFRKQIWSPPSKPVTITVNTSLPVQPTRSLQVTGLRRSESTKENRSSDFQPIPIVRGNVRRSKSILGRILGQKIGVSSPLSKPSITLASLKVDTPTHSENSKEYIAVIPSKTEPIHNLSEVEPSSSTTPAKDKPENNQQPKVEEKVRISPKLEETPKVDFKSESLPLEGTAEKFQTVDSDNAENFEKSIPDSVVESSLSPVHIRSRASSRSSSSTSSSEDENVYEVANDSDTDLSSSSDASDEEGSQTLSEIVRAAQQQPENDEENLSLPTTVETEKSDQVDKKREFEVDSNFEEEQNPSCIAESKQTEVTVDENHSTTENFEESRSRIKIVNRSLTAHPVFQIERAQIFNVVIVKPVLAGKELTDNNPISTQIEEKQCVKQSELSSSSSSSAELSDDEDSSPEENNMDRFSTRALQSRVSVKQQILATEDGNTKPSPTRRSRNDRNRPINTGDDVRSRIQKFKVQVNGDSDKPSPVKRNGSVKIPGASGKKIDVSKFEKGGDENANLTHSKGKTTITMTTATPRSTLRSNSKEENIMKSKLETEKAISNGSSESSADVDRKSRKSSSSSATEDSTRTRRTRRAKPTEPETSLEKIERVASTTTKELKDTHEKKFTSDVKISTKTSRDRATTRKEDLNNNTKHTNGDVAPPNGNENVEVLVNDSLSSWSERRRKRREKRLQMDSPVSTTSGTETEKSTEETSDNKEAEEEEKAAKTIASITHVQHSAPVLTDMDSYSFKLSRNGSREEPNIPEKEEEEQEVEESKVDRKSSSVSRSSVSSEAENTQSKYDDEDEGLTLAADKVEMDEDDVVADDTNTQSVEVNGNSDHDVVEKEREIFGQDETREVDQQEEEEVEQDKDDLSSTKEETKSSTDFVIEDDKKITENNDILEKDTLQTTNINTDTTLYNADPVDNDEQIDSTPDLEATSAENESNVTTETQIIEQKVDTAKEIELDSSKPERTRRRHKDRKASSDLTDEIDSEKPKRRHHRKKDEESEGVADDGEKSKRKHHRRHKKSTEEGIEKSETEKPVKEEKSKEKVKDDKIETKIGRSREEKESKKSETTEQDKSPKLETKEDSSATSDTKKSKETTPSTTEESKNQAAEEPPKEMHCSLDNVEEISDLSVLEKMLYDSENIDDRRRIRSVMRAIRRGEKPTKDNTLKPRTTNGSAITTKSNIGPSPGDLAKRGALPKEGARESRLTSTKMAFTKLEKTDTGSKYTSLRAERTTMSSGQKKIGSIFDRGEDDDDSRKSSRSGSSRMADLERRQAERKRELQRNRSMPASSSKDARKAFVAKLEGGAPKGQTKKVGRSPTFVVPNANNVKQLLLKWCQSKTRGYEHVDIMNFSSSWASGMAFCALVHNFFPEAFDYNKLDPKNRAENFDLAFKSAEELGGVAPLLEVEDMLIMGNRPDSKCVFTYVQFLYSHFRKYDQPLVPLKEGEGKSGGASSQKLVIKKMGETEDL